jgi:nitrile hydratase accessory protein
MPGRAILSRPEGLPGQPVDGAGEPVFTAPWQAKAFALTVHLHAQGAFGWGEWAEALGREVKDQAPGAEGYYTAWLRALERLLAAKGIAAPGAVAAMAAAWQRAAEATPHGRPIRLENDPGA